MFSFMMGDTVVHGAYGQIPAVLTLSPTVQ